MNGGSHNTQGMGGRDLGMPPAGAAHRRRRHMKMHMTFFWGKNTEILFDGWPGYDHADMYIFALVAVFVLAFIVEWLSHCNYIKDSLNRVTAGLMQTLMCAIRTGLAYLVMLAVMSFNGSVFLAAVAGHSVGFFIFGSRTFKKQSSSAGVGKSSDLPPMSC